MTKDIQLYDYQKDMVRRIEEAFGSHQSVMVQMPTGTGKTHVLVEVVKDEEQRVKEPRVWIIAHRRELVSQIEETVRTFGIEPYSTEHTESKIRVQSIQWLTRHYAVMDENPTLIVIDEAHHALAKTYAEVMNAFPEAKKLGVTATPCRLKSEGLPTCLTCCCAPTPSPPLSKTAICPTLTTYRSIQAVKTKRR